jgi:hypothetical protein
MSFGEVAVRSFTDLDTTPHDGHVAAPASAVTTCTIRVPSAKRSTRSTRTPANPNKSVVASDTPLGPSSSPESLRNVQTSEGPRAPAEPTRPPLATSHLPAQNRRAGMQSDRCIDIRLRDDHNRSRGCGRSTLTPPPRQPLPATTRKPSTNKPQPRNRGTSPTDPGRSTRPLTGPALMRWTFGYPLALVLMILTGAMLYMAFKRRRWL